jgi:membrane protease YdiL (CAAX protease family)
MAGTIAWLLQSDVDALAEVFKIIVGAVGGINAALLILWLYRRERGRPLFAPVWSVADVWFGAQLAVALLVFLMIPLSVAFYMLAGAKAAADMNSPAALLYFVLPGTIVQNLVFFAVPALFIGVKYGQRLRDIGLPSLPSKRDWTAGLLLGTFACLFAFFLGAVIEGIAEQFRHIEWVKNALEFEKNNPVAQIVTALPKLGIAGLVLAVLGIGIGAPLGEEMFFRGFAFTALRRRFGLATGLIVSALLFTLPHTYALGLLPVFLLGLLMAWTYHNSGSLWIPIIIHAVNNTASVLLAYFVPSLT